MGHTPQFIGGKKERRKEAFSEANYFLSGNFDQKKDYVTKWWLLMGIYQEKKVWKERDVEESRPTHQRVTVSVIRLEAGDSRDPEL